MHLMSHLLCSALVILLARAPLPEEESYDKWPLSKAVKILNASAWARHETFTKVVGGVGSGVAGEKEIYNTFYVRFLSARPIREAFTRIQQIQQEYDSLTEQERRHLDERLRAVLDLDVERWIIVSLGFRSNDPNEESLVRRFFESETTETMRNRAFLSTESLPQVGLAAYFSPVEESVGAKFVFPRHVNGEDIVGRKTERITFELLRAPGTDSGSGQGAGRGGRGGRFRDADRVDASASESGSDLRSTFRVEDMVIGGELVF